MQGWLEAKSTDPKMPAPAALSVAGDLKSSTALITAADAKLSRPLTRTTLARIADTLVADTAQPTLFEDEIFTLQSYQGWSGYNILEMQYYIEAAIKAVSLGQANLVSSSLLTEATYVLANRFDQHHDYSLKFLKSPLTQLVMPRGMLNFYFAALVNKNLLNIFIDPITNQLSPDAYLNNIATKIAKDDPYLIANNPELIKILLTQMNALYDYHSRMKMIEHEKKLKEKAAFLKAADEAEAKEEKTGVSAHKAKDFKQEDTQIKKLRKEIENFYDRFCAEKNMPEHKEVGGVFQTLLPYQNRDAIKDLKEDILKNLDRELKKLYPHYPLLNREWFILTLNRIWNSETAIEYAQACVKARLYLVSETIPGDDRNTQIIDSSTLKQAALLNVDAAITILSTTLVDNPLDAAGILKIYEAHIRNDKFYSFCSNLQEETLHPHARLTYLVLQTRADIFSPRVYDERFTHLYFVHLGTFNEHHPAAQKQKGEQLDDHVCLLLRKRRDPWELLAISDRNADDKMVNAAFKTFSRLWHPDRNPADKGQQLRLGTAAHKVLSDPVLKAQYLKVVAQSSDEKHTPPQAISYDYLKEEYITRIKSFLKEEGVSEKNPSAGIKVSTDDSFSDIQDKERALRKQYREEIYKFLDYEQNKKYFPSYEKFKAALGFPSPSLPPLEIIQKVKQAIILELKKTIENELQKNILECDRYFSISIDIIIHNFKDNCFGPLLNLTPDDMTELNKMLAVAKQREEELNARLKIKAFVDTYKHYLPSHDVFTQQLDSKKDFVSPEVQQSVVRELRDSTLQVFPKISASDIREAIAAVQLNWAQRLLYTDPDYIIELDSIMKATHAFCGWRTPLDPVENIAILRRLIHVLFIHPEFNKALPLANHQKLNSLRNLFPKLIHLPKDAIAETLKSDNGLFFLHVDNYHLLKDRFKIFFDAMEILPSRNLEIFLKLVHKG